jgi:hypothetical protein
VAQFYAATWPLFAPPLTTSAREGESDDAHFLDGRRKAGWKS